MPDSASNLYRYTIEPRAPHLGGGWRLRCFQNDAEVAGGVFPPDTTAKDYQIALDDAHCEATWEGESWLADRQANTSGDAAPAPTLIRVGPDDL